MKKLFENIILFGKRHSEETTKATLLELKSHLEQKGINVFIEEETAVLLNIQQATTVSEAELANKGDLIIVIGGDGSLLNAARAAVMQDLPVLGINRGRLGFLTDISPEAFSSIDKILQGQYQTEQRFLLQAEIHRHGQRVHQQLALNDVVLLPGDISHMIEFSIEIDQAFVCTQRADGLIVATPTGSTAYALSGGGPILHPQLEAIVLVPMFPHRLSSRPIVVNGRSNITIQVSPHNEAPPSISCDGQMRVTLEPADSIHIHQAKKRLTLIHPEDYQYFQTLRTKLQWENPS